MRSKKLENLVEQGFITQEQAEYLEDAIARKESVVISGHRGHGLTQLFGSLLMSLDKENTTFKQVRKPEKDLEDGYEYYIIGDLKDADWESILMDIWGEKGGNVMVMKAPEYSYSVMKILRNLAKQGKANNLVLQVVECKKIGEEKKVDKIVRTTVDEKGKPVRETFNG